MSSSTLLIADDSVTIQKVIGLTFASDDVEVVSVSDGNSAIDHIRELSPDLVMADVNIPGMNGYEICETVKSMDTAKEIPVILLVGSFEPFDEEKAQRVGADGFLTKPFESIARLVEQVSLLLKKGDSGASTAGRRRFDDTVEYPADSSMVVGAQAGHGESREPLPASFKEDFEDETIETERPFGGSAQPVYDDETVQESPEAFDSGFESGPEPEEVVAEPEYADHAYGEEQPSPEPQPEWEDDSHDAVVHHEEPAAEEFRDDQFDEPYSEDTVGPSSYGHESTGGAAVTMELDEAELLELPVEREPEEEPEAFVGGAEEGQAEPEPGSEPEFVSYEPVDTVREEFAAPVMDDEEQYVPQSAPLYEIPEEEISEEETWDARPAAEAPAAEAPEISDELVEMIAMKVVERLSDKAVREIAWEVVPEMAEIIIRKMTEQKLKD